VRDGDNVRSNFDCLNIFQANQIGTHIITVTHDLLKKLAGVGYDLEAFSLDTVKMFYNDAVASSFSIKLSRKWREPGQISTVRERRWKTYISRYLRKLVR